MLQRESHPIPSEELDGWISTAERHLREIKGKHDLEEILKDLSPIEKYRTTPEDLTLLYAVRRGTCHYCYFSDLLTKTTGLAQDVVEMKANGGVASLDSQRKQKFCSGFALFVMASSIVATCEKKLKNKDQSKLAQLDATDFELVVGKGFDKDLSYVLSFYVDSLATAKTDKIIQNHGDVTAVTRDFWKVVIKKATQVAKETPELLTPIANTTFHHGPFRVTGLMTEDIQDVKVMTWSPVRPEEVIGDPDVTIMMRRVCDRLALFDPIVGRNPLCEYGGLIESFLVDGPPGTGKTKRYQMMMTLLAARAEQVGLPVMFKSVTADQVKSEWYGKTASMIKQMIEAVTDPSGLGFILFDDIDLLLAGDRSSPGRSGSDLDIMKAVMDLLAGGSTNYIGNYCVGAATNKPTGSDEALRQRFVYRALISGPKTKEDYMDQVSLELRGFAKSGLMQIKPGRYMPLQKLLPTSIKGSYDGGLIAKYVSKSHDLDDVGKLCEELRQRDPKFTARSIKNAIQVAVAKAADFEIPDVWFTDPSQFRAKLWEERLLLLKDLYKPLTADMLLMSLEYQFEVESRYRKEAKEKEISDCADRYRVDQQAREEVNKNG